MCGASGLLHAWQVCDDLPMRHPIQPNLRDDVLEACQARGMLCEPLGASPRPSRGAPPNPPRQDFWEEYEDVFVKMIFDRCVLSVAPVVTQPLSLGEPAVRADVPDGGLLTWAAI